MSSSSARDGWFVAEFTTKTPLFEPIPTQRRVTVLTGARSNTRTSESGPVPVAMIGRFAPVTALYKAPRNDLETLTYQLRAELPYQMRQLRD